MKLINMKSKVKNEDVVWLTSSVDAMATTTR